MRRSTCDGGAATRVKKIRIYLLELCAETWIFLTSFVSLVRRGSVWFMESRVVRHLQRRCGWVEAVIFLARFNERKAGICAFIGMDCED
jgi:hypothetical protein